MIKKIISVILLIIWMILIFSNSSDNGVKSKSKSDQVIITVVETVSNVKENTKEMDNIIDKASIPVRKMAHFTEYFILAVLFLNVLFTFGFKNKTVLITFIFCTVYAITDELHQVFVSGRSPQITDVLIDSVASLISSLLNGFIVRNVNKKSNNIVNLK